MNHPLHKITLVLCLFLIGCSEAEVEPKSADSLPTRAELTDGWNQLFPAGKTACATNTPFSFFARSAETDKLLLYFEGGGACWDQVTCQPNGLNTTYTPFVDESDEPNAAGIFDFANPDNPFADYNVVFVPYCTGDVHLGNMVQSYSQYDDTIMLVQHNGYNNSMAAINWLFDNYAAPSTVFVTGSSAGAIPSPLYAAVVAEQYPDARIEQLGDAGGAYRAEIGERLFPVWGTDLVLAQMPEVADALPSQTFEALYIAAAQLHPEITFSQFNSERDSVQGQFLRMLNAPAIGDETTLGGKIAANYADIAAADSDNFFGYIGSGSSHVILDNNSFYRVSADGIALRDWVNAIATDQPVDTVICDGCDIE